MTPISRLFNATNWKYALGEIFLIFVGISLALFANSWYESRQHRNDEIAVLNELQITLGEDLDSVAEAYETIRNANGAIVSFVNLAESGQLNSAQVSTGVWAIGRFITLNIRFGPYETLKSRGLDLISNPALRANVTTLYEDDIPNLVEDSLIDRILVRDHILPHNLEWFWLDASDQWLPKQPLADPWRSDLVTLGRYRSTTLTRHYLPSFERAMELMRDVQQQIQLEMDELQRH